MNLDSEIPAFFKGKLTVITGGGSGLGLQLASYICSYGGKVVLIGRKTKRLHKAQKEIWRDNPGAYVDFYSQDVSQYSKMKRLFNEIHAKHGYIDGVFVNASQVYINDFRSIPFDRIDQVLNTNINGAIYTARAAIPYLSKNDPFLAFTCSIAGYTEGPESSVYAASKAAIIRFSRILHLELAPRGVNVLTFSPGFFNTPFVHGATATPFLMPIERVANRYLRAVAYKQKEVVFPLTLLCIVHMWRLLTLIRLGSFFSIYSTKKMYRFYGQGDPHLDTSKESFIQDSYGVRRFICLFSFNKRMANWLHNKLGVQRERSWFNY